MMNGKLLPTYYDAGPFLLSPNFPKENLLQALDYQHRPGDIFIVTYPKNGTTWTQQLVYSILNDGQSSDQSVIVGKFLDMKGLSAVTGSDVKAAIKTHITPDLLWRNSHPEAKYIVVVRNPKDTCVSFFYHTVGFSAFNFQKGKFDDFFDLFMEGKTEYGDYFKWITAVLTYRNDDNVLFLTYESMKQDTTDAVHKIAHFLSTKEQDFGHRFFHDIEYRDRILKHSSVSHMRSVINEGMKQGFTSAHGDNASLEFVRKGQIHDYKNLMTEEQSDRLSDRFKHEARQHPDLMTIWSDYSWL